LKKPIIILASIFLFFCIGIPALTIQLLLHDCLWWECAPQRNFQIKELELPATLFQDGTIVNAIYPMSDEFETIEDGMQSIYWGSGNGSAGYNIFRYSTRGKAKDGFKFYKHMLVEPSEGEVWNLSVDLTFSSPTADELYIGCIHVFRKECAMVARYQEYVVDFRSSIDTKMTYAGFETILKYIDQQISEKISQ
jgi:hypothetical protein